MCYLVFIQINFNKINFNKTILNKRRAIHMFVGREQELASLEEFYAKDGIGMTVIYGRRRIGKSTLITEFDKNRKNQKSGAIFQTSVRFIHARN